MIYNFDALQTAVKTNRFDASNDLPTWVQQAYEFLWNAAEWTFKKVGPTAITLPVGGVPAMPADFGRLSDGGVFDDLGTKLDQMSERDFDVAYQPLVAVAQTGRPEAYKIVNRQITLGPTPDRAYVGAIAYQRRLCTRTNAGFLQTGNFNLPTDLPYWSHTEGEHHYVIALRAMMMGRNFQSDLSAQLIQSDYEAGLQAMMETFAVDDGGTTSFGADDL